MNTALEYAIQETVKNFAKSKNLVLMPKSLTAENGAKAALMGEFDIEKTILCPDCCGNGCGECDDGGYIIEMVPIQWDTIKEIYKKAVEVCGDTEGR